MTVHDAEHNKRIFANNLYYYMQIKNKTQNDIVRDLGITASTVSDWVLGKKYPRIDKMQKLADYLVTSTKAALLGAALFFGLNAEKTA